MNVDLQAVLQLIADAIERATNNIENPIPDIPELQRQDRFGWRARLHELHTIRLELLEKFDPAALHTPPQDEDQGDAPNTAPGDVGARDVF